MQTSGLFLTVFCLSAGMETKLLRHIQDGDEPLPPTNKYTAFFCSYLPVDCILAPFLTFQQGSGPFDQTLLRIE